MSNVWQVDEVEEFWPCADCLNWCLDVWNEGGTTWVRECHDPTCPRLIEMLTADLGDI